MRIRNGFGFVKFFWNYSYKSFFREHPILQWIVFSAGRCMFGAVIWILIVAKYSRTFLDSFSGRDKSTMSIIQSEAQRARLSNTLLLLETNPSGECMTTVVSGRGKLYGVCFNISSWRAALWRSLAKARKLSVEWITDQNKSSATIQKIPNWLQRKSVCQSMRMAFMRCIRASDSEAKLFLSQIETVKIIASRWTWTHELLGIWRIICWPQRSLFHLIGSVAQAYRVFPTRLELQCRWWPPRWMLICMPWLLFASSVDQAENDKNIINK